MLRLILMALLLVASAGTGQYTGPSRLGPFSVDKTTYIRKLYREVGRPRDPGADHFCYKGARGSYMWGFQMAHNPAEVGAVLVSVFPNCMGELYSHTTVDFTRWKTPEGIGLGSSEHEVLKSYGSPSDQYKTIESKYGYSPIYGSTDAYGHSLPLPREISSWILGRQVLVYGGKDDVRGAAFGLRDGHVIWIYLSDTP